MAELGAPIHRDSAVAVDQNNVMHVHHSMAAKNAYKHRNTLPDGKRERIKNVYSSPQAKEWAFTLMI